MIRVVFFTVLSIVCLQANFIKNDEFNMVVGNEYTDRANDVLESDNGSIVVVGLTEFMGKNSTKNVVYKDAFSYLKNETNRDGNKLRILKIDDLGNIVFDTKFKDYAFSEGRFIAKNANNGYTIAGVDANGNVILLKINNKGGITFKKRYEYKGRFDLKALYVLKNGHTILVADSYDHLGGVGKRDISLIKIDAFGKDILNKKVGSIKDDYFLDISLKNDSNFLMCYLIKDEGKLNLMEFDSFFNVINVHNIFENIDVNSCNIASKNGTHTVVNHYNLDEESIINVTNFNKFLSVNWSREYGKDHSRGLNVNDTTIATNGDIFIAGSIDNDGFRDGFLKVLDRSGREVFEKTLGGDGDDHIKKILPLKDSNLVLVGGSNSYTNIYDDMWIFKITGDGTLLKRALYKKSAKELYERFLQDLSNYDLIVKKDLTITFKDDIFLFDTGSHIVKDTNVLKMDDFFKAFTDIVYNEDYRHIIKEIRIDGFTSSEWGRVGANEFYANDKVQNDKRYLKNSELSMKRAFEILGHILNSSKDDDKSRWLKSKMSVNGYSYSKTVKKVFYDGFIEDERLSRRVEIRILLN